MRLSRRTAPFVLVALLCGLLQSPAHARTLAAPMRASIGRPAPGATGRWWTTVKDSIGASAFGLTKPKAQVGDWMVESDQTNAQMGRFVGPAGDVNGDGYDDVIVGADYWSTPQYPNEGKAFVYLGSATGLSTTPAWTFESQQAGALLGHSVWTANDVNGDGYDDVIVGANLYDDNFVDEGRAYVFEGGPTGLSPTPNWTFDGGQAGASFGRFVWRAGDVNGDGYGDVIIGAPYWDGPGYVDEGKAFAFYGSAAGLSPTPNWTAVPNQAGARFGQAVSTAGDVNGDGYDEVIVGADFYDHGQTDEGRAFVFYGSATGLSPTANWTGESNQAGANYGYWVDKAGDVNGDGYGDIIIGANAYHDPEPQEGKTYVYLGSATGLNKTPVWTAEGDQRGALYGYSCGTAGDVNGDGYADILVTAERYDDPETNEGIAYIYFGSPTGPSPTPNWTAESNQVRAQLGYSSGGAGDLDGDGLADVIIGMPLWDNPEVDEGAAVVFYGSGIAHSAIPRGSGHPGAGLPS